MLRWLVVWRCSWMADALRAPESGAQLDRLHEIDETLKGLDEKAADQLMADLDEISGGRYASGAATVGDYQEELLSCGAYGVGP